MLPAHILNAASRNRRIKDVRNRTKLEYAAVQVPVVLSAPIPVLALDPVVAEPKPELEVKQIIPETPKVKVRLTAETVDTIPVGEIRASNKKIELVRGSCIAITRAGAQCLNAIKDQEHKMCTRHMKVYKIRSDIPDVVPRVDNVLELVLDKPVLPIKADSPLS